MNHRRCCCTAPGNEHLVWDHKQTLHDIDVMKLGKVSTSCNGLNNSLRVWEVGDDNLPSRTASQHGLDSSYSEASVLETQV